MNASARFAVDLLLLWVFSGCGSGSPPDGPAVPDPGGPFHASIESSRRIDGLTVVESDTLCRDVANAFYAFLQGAVDTANVCGEGVTAMAEGQANTGQTPADAGALCQMEYDQCVHMVPPVGSFFCPIPTDDNPSPCDATVEDLSACLNEIAALDPVGTCRMYPACGGASAAMDAASHPAIPACDRLGRICPAFRGLATFPC